MNIIYTGLFAYPDSSANSLRVRGIVQILKDLGHTVTVCGGLPANSTVGDDENIKQINEYANGIFSGVNGIRGMFIGDNTIDWLESLAKKPDIIILYGTHLGYLIRLLTFTKKYNIKLILDVVEWYDPRHLPGGLFGPFALMNELSMRFFVKRANGLIVISEYLGTYYDRQKCKTVLIPPVFLEDQKNRQLEHVAKEKLNLCYVGTPGKKENFLLLFKILNELYLTKQNFKMHFVGMTKEDFLNSYDLKEIRIVYDENYCRFYGKLPNDEAKKIIASCDFMLVLRPDQKFANAGFPSKVPESLSLGTPVFCNKFSDLSSYILDGYNGFILDQVNVKNLIVTFKEMLNMSLDQSNKMRLNAHNTYEEHFNYKNYLEKLSYFLKEVK